MTLPSKGAGGSAKWKSEIIHYDSFTDTPLTLLTNHTPEIGNGYVNITATHRITAGGIVAEAVGSPSFIWTDPGKRAGRLYFRWRNFLDAQLLRIGWRMGGAANWYYVEPFTFGNTLSLKKEVATVVTPLDSAAVTIANQTWYQCWIEDDGTNIAVYHAGDLPATKPDVALLSAVDAGFPNATGIGFEMLAASQRFDDITAWLQ